MRELCYSKVFFPVLLLLFTLKTYTQQAVPGQVLPDWEQGYLDIHHINTGRGNATYCIFPDGTTLLIDAGELSPLDARTFSKRNAEARPDTSLKPFEWIAAYIKQVAPVFNLGLDYAVITHFHDDHFGAWYPGAPWSSGGRYRLTGITGVAEKIPVAMLIDRGFPAYKFPYDLRTEAARYGGGEIAFDSTMANYFAFIAAKQKAGMRLAALKPGSNTQIALKFKQTGYPSFFVRNVKTGPYIWTGRDSSFVNHFPGSSKDPGSWPDENSLSLALTIHYGPFVYYTGGDNPGNIFKGDHPLRDVETPIAMAVGEVDVAVMDHHGNRDAINENAIKILSPAVWIGQTWSSDHPGHEVLLRLTNKHINTHTADLFATNMLEANKLVIGPLIDRAYKSQQGHIVVRVLPGGLKYYILVLDDSVATAPVKAVFGPYLSKTNKSGAL